MSFKLHVMEKEMKLEDDIQIVVVTDIEVPSFVKGYHVYRNLWTPILKEELYGEMEPSKPVDKYAAVVKKGELVVGHLPLDKSGKFAKTIFYFLRADPYGKCKKIVTGKPINRGDGDGMQVPCLLQLSVQRHIIEILKQQINDQKKIQIKN